MAVVKVKENWERRDGDIDDKFVRNYTRSYTVLTNSATDTAFTVRNATGIPRIWDAHNEDADCLCTSVRPSQSHESPTTWEVLCKYSSEIADQSQQAENPLDEPARIRWTVERYQQAIDEDKDPAGPFAIRNSAQDPFENPPEIERGRLMLTITKNQPDFDDIQAAEFLYTTNSTAFMGKDAGKMLLVDYSGERAFKNNLVYWPVTYAWHIRDEGWTLRLLDQGYREPVAGVQKDIQQYGKTISSPALLDTTGGKLAVGQPGQFLEFIVYGSKDHNVLGVP